MIFNTAGKYASRLYAPPPPVTYFRQTYGDEFNGPYPSWKNIKTQFGAVGNDIADDTAAFQAALDTMNPLVNGELKPENEYNHYVIYVPPGTYRVSAKLRSSQKQWIALIGHHPSTTKIKWIGAAGENMLYVHSNWYSRFSRITWDGNGIAGACIEQNRIHDGYFFDTGNQISENVFMNAESGIKAGFSGGDISAAEISIGRNHYKNCQRGVIIGNFNSLDVWVRDSLFEDCGVGITNGSGGAGGWRSYNNNFYRSTVADHAINDVVEFSIRDCYSFQSKKFFEAGPQPNPCPIVIESNRIEDSIDVDTIVIKNHGPASIFDNEIKSKANASGKVIRLETVAYNDLGQTHPYNNGQLFTMNNKFTVPNPIEVGQNTLLQGDAPIIVDRSALTITPNLLVPVQPNVTRPIFEVPVGSNTAQIQAICDQAALLKGQRPVVHFPSSVYPMMGTLRFNEGLDTVLEGDGYSSRLRRIETDPRINTPSISIAGPTKMQIKNLQIDGLMRVAPGVEVSNIDQRGSRVFLSQAEIHGDYKGIWVDRLDHTKVMLNDSGITFCTIGIEVTGGRKAEGGFPAEGRTIMYGGCNFINPLSIMLSKGANLLVRDYWYESNYDDRFAIVEGKATFVMESSRIATAPVLTYPAILLKDLDGKFLMLNCYLTNDVKLEGDGSKAKVLIFGSETDIVDFATFVKNQATGVPAGAIRSYLRRAKSSGSTNPPPEGMNPVSGSFSVPDNGPAPDNAYLTEMFAPVRGIPSEVPDPLDPSITDFRMDHVWIQKCSIGLHLVEHKQ